MITWRNWQIRRRLSAQKITRGFRGARSARASIRRLVSTPQLGPSTWSIAITASTSGNSASNEASIRCSKGSGVGVRFLVS